MKNLFYSTLTACLAVFIIGCKESVPVKQANNKLELKLAGYDYDRVNAIRDGKVGIEGAEVNFEVSNIYAMNKSAFGPEQKFEVIEIGLIPYITRYMNDGFRDYTLIPVFISRTFRHRNIYVHTDSGIETPEDLKGKRIGTPGYGMSANTWIRGMLLDEYGVKADDFQWVESDKSSDGKELNSGFAKYYFGEDFPLTKGPDGIDESELLLNGQVDALITAITPKAYLDEDPNIKQLFPKAREVEAAYFKKTGMFPIMHAIAIRNDVLEENPWLAKAVFEMYSEAKDMAYKNLETTTVVRTSLPWTKDEYESTVEIMGDNYWKYGIEDNRKELEAIMRYVYEQGLTKEQIGFEEMFASSTLELVE